MKAAEDRVLVRLMPKQKVSTGGIIIPDSAQKNSITGIVISVGPKVREDIRVRDEVIFGEYAGAVVREAGKDNPTPIVALVEGEILAVVRDEEFFEEDEDAGEIAHTFEVAPKTTTMTVGETYLKVKCRCGENCGCL